MSDSNWNEDTLTYSLWGQFSASYLATGQKVFSRVNYVDICEGNTKKLATMFLLIQHINRRNEICKYDKHANAFVPIQSKEELYTVAGIGKDGATRKKLNEWLEEKNIIRERHIMLNGVKTKYFYLNPLLSMNGRLYIHTYILFRDRILNNDFCKLTEKQKDALEKYAKIYGALTNV